MTNPNDPAFQSEPFNEHGIKMLRESGPHFLGLSKREYFASLAMNGYLAGICSIQPDARRVKEFADAWIKAPIVGIKMADELIAELNRTEDKKHDL